MNSTIKKAPNIFGGVVFIIQYLCSTFPILLVLGFFAQSNIILHVRLRYILQETPFS